MSMCDNFSGSAKKLAAEKAMEELILQLVYNIESMK